MFGIIAKHATHFTDALAAALGKNNKCFEAGWAYPLGFFLISFARCFFD
jgi:hypothetical protein